MSSRASSATYDQAVLQLLLAGTPAQLADVIRLMEGIDQLLPGNDGLKWFNLLYLSVTREIEKQTAAGLWQDPAWIAHLDVVFAQLYFEALRKWLQRSADVPSSWKAMLDCRFVPKIDRIQFALAGMNAHINHDLALALLQTDADLHVSPRLGSPQHNDYERVNVLLDGVVPAALEMLAVGLLGQLAQDTGKIGRLLGIWNVSAARDLAWGFAGHLRAVPKVSRAMALAAQDQMTGVIGRSLLLPIDPAPLAT